MILLLAGEERTKTLLRSHQSSWSWAWVWVMDVSWGKNSTFKILKSVYHSEIAISVHALLSRTVGDECATEIMSPSSGLYHHGSQPIGISICAGSFIGVLPPVMRLSFVFAVPLDESGQMVASSCYRAQNWQICQFLMCLTFNTHTGKYFCTASHTEYIHML